MPRQYITLFRLCQVDFAILSDFLRTLRQFRRFRSAPNSQTLSLKNPTALGAPAYPLPAPFACSPSALLSEKDLQAERSTLPSRRRLQTCFAHSQIPLRRTSYATALFSAKPTGVLRAFANLPQSERLKRNTQNNNRSYFCLLDKSRLRSYRKVCISFPITKASFAFLQKNVRADNKKLYIVPDN